MSKVTVYHLIDHNGFGTMHKLLIPLSKKYSNHHVLIPTKDEYGMSRKMIGKINKNENAMIIIHSSGSNSAVFIQNFKEMFPNKKIFIFMHTSANYQKLKGREQFIKYLEELCVTENIKILVPSKEVADQYKKYHINVSTIQLGIPKISNKKKYSKNRKKLRKYYNKIITTCSSDNEIYKYVKGIDLFEEIITRNHLEDNAIIAGTENINNSKIFCKKFKEEDFLNILKHSKMYIQLSRFDTYNITAVQAKQFKIPVLVIKTEGTSSCMGINTFANVKELEEKMINILSEKYEGKEVIENYKDSMKREKLKNFKESIEREFYNE